MLERAERKSWAIAGGTLQEEVFGEKWGLHDLGVMTERAGELKNLARTFFFNKKKTQLQTPGKTKAV